MEIKGEIDSNAVIVGGFCTPWTSVDRSFREKINKEPAALNDILDQMELIDIFSTFHIKTAKYTFFTVAHFSRVDHRLGHKRNLTKFKKI